MSTLDIQSIREALPIEQVLELHCIRLRSGRGPCPICVTSARSSSFSVRALRFRCFACNEHGDVVDLVAKLDRVSLREAITRSAQLAGVIPGIRPAAPRPQSPWRPAQHARDEAWRHYLEALEERGRATRRYEKSLRRRGGLHALSICLGGLLAEAYDQEAMAAYAYECAMENLP